MLQKKDPRVNGVKSDAMVALISETKTDPEKKKEDRDGKDEKDKPMVTVGTREVFRFADGRDRFLIVFGTLAALAYGAVMPLMIIVFGNMTDSFLDNGQWVDFVDDFWGNLTAANITLNFTKKYLIKNPNYLMDLLIKLNMSDVVEEVKNEATESFLDEINKHAIYFSILGACVFVVGYVQMTCWITASARQTQKIRTLLFRSILKQEIGWFDTHEIGELNTRLSDDIQKIQDGIGDKLGMFFQFSSTFVTGFVIGFVYGWKLTLVIISVCPLLALSGVALGLLGTSVSTKELKANAKAGAVAEEVLGAIRTVVAFGGQAKETKRYSANLQEAMKYGIQKGIALGGCMGMLLLVLFGAYALAFWYGSKLVREEEYTGGKLLVVFFSVLAGAFSLGAAGPSIQAFSTARGAAYAIFEIIDNVPLIDSSDESGKRPQKIHGNVEFTDIKFTYPARPDVQVLKGINLKIKVGQTVALVGSSGCGKSTTVQLLQRFYDPDEGKITIDGLNIREWNVQYLRQQIGVVSQEPVLFGTTIAENIRYGKNGVSQHDIESAAKEANAHDFISKLPKRYGTLVGERGAQLSGGQKQRIAIARALVRDPKILVLDEATSALDAESEATVQAALDKVRMGRTTLIVAHRLSTIKTADVIVGLDNGNVVETGTHKELMAIKGVYHTLVTNQSLEKRNSVDDDDNRSKEKKKKKRKIIIVKDDDSLTKILNKSLNNSLISRTSVGSITWRYSVGTNKGEEDDFGLKPAGFRRILSYNAPEWYYMLIGLLASIISGGIQPTIALVLSEILGVFQIRDLKKQEQESNKYSFLFLVTGVVAAVAMLIQLAALSISGERLTSRLRLKTFQTYLRQNIAYFDDPRHNTGALTRRLATDASEVQGATGSQMSIIAQGLSSILIGLGIGFYYSWKLTLLVVSFAPFVMIGGAAHMKAMTGNKQSEDRAFEEAGKIAIESIENIRTVATLTKEEKFYQDYCKVVDVPFKKSLKLAHVSGVSFGFSQCIVLFAYAGCFRFGAYLIREDSLEFKNMFKVVTAIAFSALSVGKVSSLAPDYEKAKISAARLFKLFDRVPEIDSSDESGEKLALCVGNVEFHNVRFNYPTRPDIPILQGLWLKVKAGETLALVGSSGCGKSTAVSLMERFYDPLGGEVLLDDKPTQNLHIQWLRSQMGIVSQEPILFDCSIRENIAYGDNNREVSMAEIIKAARDANIHNFIETLPEGYETNVGDKGTQLSGGQKQRVAIARALIRNPKILLLDEATSALDTESEKVVQEALDKAQEGRTSIVIAHRLSTIKNADTIAVIHNGRVAEQGTHSQLIAKQGIYYKLNTTQMKQK